MNLLKSLAALFAASLPALSQDTPPPQDGAIDLPFDVSVADFTSAFSPELWQNNVVATGVNSIATIDHTGRLRRLAFDRDGYTIGSIIHTKGDLYTYADEGWNNTGNAWLHLDAGPGNFSVLHHKYVSGINNGWKAGNKHRFFSPTKILGSPIQFSNDNCFEPGAYPILAFGSQFSEINSYGNKNTRIDFKDGAHGVGNIAVDCPIPDGGTQPRRRDVHYHATRPFGGGFYMSSAIFHYCPHSLPVETAAPVPASLPSGVCLHLDASASDSISLDSGFGLAAWRDLSPSQNHASPVGSLLPEFREREIADKPVVSFGGWLSDSSLRAHLRFANPFSTAGKTLFWVIGSRDGGGSLLAAPSAASRTFKRGGTGGTSFDDPIFAESRPNVTVRLNGSVVDPVATGLSGSFDIVAMTDVSLSSNGDVAGLACEIPGVANSSNAHQDLAEFIVFDRVLSESEIKSVESFLAAKWLSGRTDIRRNMIFHRQFLNVAESDRTVTIQHLNGPGVLVKDGPGAIRIEHPAKFTGCLELKGGKLVLGSANTRPRFTGTPALPQDGMIFRLDASDPSSIDLTNGFVKVWRDADGRDIFASVTNFALAQAAPFFHPSAVNGRPGVDFGRGSDSFNRCLSFSKRLSGRTLMIAQNSIHGGGYFLADSANPYADRGGALADGGWNYSSACRFFGNSTDITSVYLDGRSLDPYRNHPSAAPEIVTIITRTRNFSNDNIGWDRFIEGRRNGQLVGEYIVWDRILSDDERRAAEAWLHDKWLAGRSALRSLRITGDATLEISEDVAIDSIDGPGSLVKTGPGVLTVNSTGLSFDKRKVRILGGSVVFKAGNGPAPESLPVADPVIWTDASAEGTLEIGESGCTWRDSRPESTWQATAASPAGLSIMPAELNGRNALDAGHVNCSRFVWPEPRLDLKTFFIVKGSRPIVNNQNGGGILAWTSSNNNAPWARINYSGSFSNFILAGEAQPIGRFWLNGTECSPFVTGYSGGWEMLTLEAGRTPMYADAFDNKQQIAEFIAYDRFLTPAERRSVEAYLSRKWFAKGMHGYTVPGEIHYPGRDLPEGETWDVDLPSGESAAMGWVTGGGSIVKRGEGTLNLAGATAAFRGSLDIRNGAVAYTAPKYSGETPSIPGLIARFDSSAPGTVSKYPGTDIVESWTDVTGAYLATNYHYLSHNYTTLKLLENEANGKPVLAFGPGPVGNKGSTLVLANPIENVRSLFAFVGTQDGRGTLVQNTPSKWHQGYQDGWNSTESSIWHDNFGKAYVDGEGPFQSNATGILRESAYQTITGLRNNSASVESICGDRPQSSPARGGGFRVGELLFFSTPVTDDQRREIETYLSCKWQNKPVSNFNCMVASTARAGSLSMAQGTFFDLNGFTQTVNALAGGGTVRGDLVLESPALWTFTPGVHFTVEGALTIPSSGTFALPEGVSVIPGSYKIAEAGQVIVQPGPRNWKTGLEVRSGPIKVNLHISDNTVYATVSGRGLLIQIR